MTATIHLFSHSAESRAKVLEAIAALKAKREALKEQGIEKGSVQAYRPGRYRLMWREGDVTKSSKTIPSELVGQYRAAHDRWCQCQQLERQIKELENWLEEFAQTA